jgi:hypothetical protein
MAKAQSRVRLRTWRLTFDSLERNNSEPRQEVAQRLASYLERMCTDDNSDLKSDPF